LKTTVSKSSKKRYRLRSTTCTISESGPGNPTWVNTNVFRASWGQIPQQQKYRKLFESFAQKKANNSKHGFSQKQIFTETNMLITSPVWYVVTCSCGDL